MAALQTFTRLAFPHDHPDQEVVQPIITDIYNKIEAIKGQTQASAATIPTAAQVQAIAVAAASSAAGSGSAIPAALNAIIPIVLMNPNSNPLLDENGNTVKPLDGAVVSWNIGGSDVGVIYQYSASGGTWSYFSGQVSRTQANLATLAALLAAADTGLLVDVTDFAHTLRWTGSAWTYADPTDPAGRVEMFLIDPNPTTGWHLLDGTANVPYLKKDGTTGTQTLPDLVSAGTNAAYPKMGSPASATVNPPVAPDTALSYNAGTSTLYVLAEASGTGSHTAQAKINAANDATTGLTALDNGTNGEPQNLVLRPWFRT